MSNEQATDRHRISLRWVVLFVLSLLGYVLSQAPVTMLLGKSSGVASFHLYVLGDNPVYVPVDLLVTHTPLRYPLLKWADVWSVEYGEELSVSVAKPGVSMIRNVRLLDRP